MTALSTLAEGISYILIYRSGALLSSMQRGPRLHQLRWLAQPPVARHGYLLAIGILQVMQSRLCFEHRLWRGLSLYGICHRLHITHLRDVSWLAIVLCLLGPELLLSFDLLLAALGRL